MTWKKWISMISSWELNHPWMKHISASQFGSWKPKVSSLQKDLKETTVLHVKKMLSSRCHLLTHHPPQHHLDFSCTINSSPQQHTVDGRNPAPPGMYKPCKQWDKLPTSTGDRRISSINSTTCLSRIHKTNGVWIRCLYINRWILPTSRYVNTTLIPIGSMGLRYLPTFG